MAMLVDVTRKRSVAGALTMYTSYANISIVIPQCSSSSFRSLRNHPTTLYRDASGSKGKAKVLTKKIVCWLRGKKRSNSGR